MLAGYSFTGGASLYAALGKGDGAVLREEGVGAGLAGGLQLLPDLALALMAAGAFFVLFYTWPLKYIGLGELAVIIVWGPLMVGGGYFVVTGDWSWQAALAIRFPRSARLPATCRERVTSPSTAVWR